MRLPNELREGITEEAAAVTGDALTAVSREMTERYRKGALTVAALTSPAHRMAYLQTRLPATFAANVRVFQEIRHLLPDVHLHSLLDLGAGPGTSLWAAVEVFPTIRTVTAVERDPLLIQLGRRLASRSHHPALQRATWVEDDFSSNSGSESHDLVVISYALGELDRSHADAAIRQAWSRTEKVLAVIEPGTTKGFAYILGARTTLIDAGIEILAPCPHEAPCPMAEAQDWCHFPQRLERTAEHRRAKGGELGYEDEKFSYVVGTRAPAQRPEARIVRHPLKNPGHVRLTLCTAEGLKQRTIGRSQKPLYRAARKAEWGDGWNERDG